MRAKPDSAVGLLVVGYGNTLRQDDGIGPCVARRIARLHLPRVKVIACAQLAPELAAEAARADAVIFVDAATAGRASVRLRRVRPEPAASSDAHALGPAALVALAGELYGRKPRAWMIGLPVRNLGYGDALSQSARISAREAVRRIRTFAQLQRLSRRAVPRYKILAKSVMGKP